MEYSITPTKKQKTIIKTYWKSLQDFENMYFSAVQNLEKLMSKETGIKDLEFFSCDGAYVGVGNADRTMKLIQIR